MNRLLSNRAVHLVTPVLDDGGIAKSQNYRVSFEHPVCVVGMTIRRTFGPLWKTQWRQLRNRRERLNPATQRRVYAYYDMRYVCIVYMVHHARRVGYMRTHAHTSACSQAVGLIQPYKLHKAVCRRFVLKIRRYWRVFQSVDSESISASLSCLPTVT